jgi:hypothetical protein
MEPESSLTCSNQTAKGQYPERDNELNPHPPIPSSLRFVLLLSSHLLLGIPNKFEISSFQAVKMSLLVFWIVMPCGLVGTYVDTNISEEYTASNLRDEDIGSMFLRDSGNVSTSPHGVTTQKINIIVSSRFPTQILYVFLISSMTATRSAHAILLDLMILIVRLEQ